MTDENNQIKLFLYENWARTKTGQHTVFVQENLHTCVHGQIIFHREFNRVAQA